MKRFSTPDTLLTNPFLLIGSLLLVTFCAELLVMLLLPHLFPGNHGYLPDLADALFLTALSALPFWWLIVRPLREMALNEAANSNAVLDSIMDAVISFAPDGAVVWMNPAAGAMFGYHHQEFEALPIGRLLPALAARGTASPGEPSTADLCRQWERGCETQARHRDGLNFPVELCVGTLERGGQSFFIANVHDLSKSRRASEMVEEQREYLESLVQQSAVPLFVVSPEHRVLLWNRACEELTGVMAQDMLGTDELWKPFYPEQRPILADLVLSGDLEQAHECYGLINKSSFIPGGVQSEGWFLNVNGRDRYIIFDAAPIRNSKGELLAVVETLNDITKRKSYEEQLSYQANHDALTGLPNRNLLSDRICQALLVARRSGQQVAVLALDLDNFKLINDTLGHDGGDLLLKEIALRLTRCVRAGDTVARQGGDEFVVILSDQATAEIAPLIAANILEAVAQPLMIEKHEFSVTISIGISISPRDGEDVQTLLKNSEVAMYRAKEQARNTFQFYTGEMNARSLARMTMEKHLRRALERDELVVHYQPKLSLSSGAITGLEALVRWNSPELGMIGPDTFIPLAEETGLIVPIGTWVLKTACAQNKAWQDAGLPLLAVAVNLSPRQFRQQNIASLIEACLQETGLHPYFLELEITESMVMQEVDRVSSVLDELKRMGVTLAMDDFGTGYSSLGYLKRFPFDKLKIDQSFVRDITCDPHNAAIAKTVIAMAHTLHMKVIAEGVETQGQLNYLHRHGCDEMQGYFFSRPVPACEVEAMLRERRHLPAAALSQGHREKAILLVDDDQQVLHALRSLLQLEGYQVLTATNGIEGLEMLSLNSISVVISDFRMPGMNGAEFLGRAKELYPDTVRIMLSAYADLESATDAINLGAVFKFLSKPWQEEEIRNRVGEAFRYHALINGRGLPSD